MHRWPLIVAAVLATPGCGRIAPDQSDATASGGASSAEPITPSVPAPQPSVPDDAPCNTASGQVVQLYAGHPEAFAVDGAFVYISDYMQLTRVPIAGGAQENSPRSPGT